MYAFKNSSLIPIKMKGVFSQKGLLCSPVFSTYTFLSFLFLLVGLALSLDLGIMKKSIPRNKPYYSWSHMVSRSRRSSHFLLQQKIFSWSCLLLSQVWVAIRLLWTVWIKHFHFSLLLEIMDTGHNEVFVNTIMADKMPV